MCCASRLIAVCVGCLLPASGLGQAQEAPTSISGAASDAKETNNGEDFTRPLTRTDFRYQYRHLDSRNNDNHIFTFRVDRPIPLDESWKLSLRLDLPLRYANIASDDHPSGQYQFGTGDLLTQIAIIKTLDPRWAVGAGSQFIFPTASKAEMDSGRYQAVPIVGVRYMWPEISSGSFAEAVIRYQFDYAGGSNRHHVSNLQFQPALNIHLPDFWFVELYPSADIRVNLGTRRAGDTGSLFLPFDVMVGKSIGKGLVTSVEVGVPIINDYKIYDFKMEARISFFF